ncbi:hypothetical protein K6U72_09125 [Vibrio furnissii]|nr:hypothetical protein [Vibrio furnissii]
MNLVCGRLVYAAFAP